jgi:hypothetical protein
MDMPKPFEVVWVNVGTTAGPWIPVWNLDIYDENEMIGDVVVPRPEREFYETARWASRGTRFGITFTGNW